MKIPAFALALASLFAPLAGHGATETGPREHSPLEDSMEDINAAYRKLGRQITDASKNADSLKQAAILRSQAVLALKLEPQRKTDLPEAEQARFIAAYQEKMKAFIADIGKLEDALKAGKNDEAAIVLKALKQAQEDGHKEFRRRKATFQEKAAEAAKRSEKFNEETKAGAP